MDKEILELLLASIRESNRLLPAKQMISESAVSQLFGDKGPLDSLGLVNFIVIVEDKIFEKYGRILTLANERAMSRKNSPFKTVSTLASYVEELLSEDVNGNK